MTDSASARRTGRHRFLLPVHRAVARHHRLGGAEDAHADHFYAAGRSVTGLQNGLALAGDYMSAASFLGIAGLVALSGFDGLIYSIGFLVGWPIVMFLIAEPLRNLGRYTFADVVASRLRQTPVRIAAADRLAGGHLVLSDRADGGRRQPDPPALRPPVRGRGGHRRGGDARLRALRRHDRDDLGADRQGRAAAGGRLAAGAPGAGALRVNPLALFAQAAASTTARSVLAPGRLVSDPLDAVSLGLALMLGTAGLPHILMRFYTVPDARTARTSVSYATAFIGFFYLLTFVLGFGAMVMVGQDAIRAVDTGGNMAAPLWRRWWAARLPRASSRPWPSPPSWRWWPA